MPFLYGFLASVFVAALFIYFFGKKLTKAIDQACRAMLP